MNRTETAATFTKVFRHVNPEGVWMRDDKPVWIVHYPEVKGIRLAFYEAYKAIQPVPKGRDPWSIDNRRLSNGDGFRTLKEAKSAASAA